MQTITSLFAVIEMSRSVILVILLVVAVVAPFWLFNQSEEQGMNSNLVPPPLLNPQAEFLPRAIPPQDATFSQASFRKVTSPAQIPNSPESGEPYLLPQSNLQPPSNLQRPGGVPSPPQPFGQLPGQPNGSQIVYGNPVGQVPWAQGEIPAAAETYFFPGNQFGPDLSAGPMAFQPVTDLRQIFRFDITPAWVKQRWERVSTTTIGLDFRSLRVALVTGVNPWDIHGSLTYYFDKQQKLQRISFRGWTGDDSHFLKVMTAQFPFKSKPTNWAGVYTAKRSGLFSSREYAGILMKEPAVIQQQNRTERLAIVMELNNPDGNLSLSTDYLELESQAVQQ